MIKNIPRLIFAFFLLSGCSFTNSFLAQDQSSLEMIRVAVLRDADTLRLKINGPYTVLDLESSQMISEGRTLKEQSLDVSTDGIRLASEDFHVQAFKIVAQREAAIFVNNKSFRGEVDIVKTANGKLTVINVVELEKYIKGVLAHEVPDRWPLEALKAQAVAARTYALYIKENKRHALYDLTNDIFSQVYGGRSGEKYRTNLAVDQTRGIVVVHNDKLLPTYYHSTCAGYTEDVRELWGEDLVPLRGQVCVFCAGSPHSSWKRNMRLKDIQDRLNEYGHKIGLIKDIQVVERNRSQRVTSLKITARDGAQIVISGKDFRNIIGPNFIKSNNYAIEMKGYYIDFYGKGWGHGVGLCQWGAHAMAQRGYRFEDILKYYYPGARIVHYQVLKRKSK